MTNGLGEFLDAYDEHRGADQAGFYEKRTKEYETSARQIGWAGEACLFVAAACGVLAAVWSDQAVLLGVVAAGLAALAVALTSWGNIIGFAANAELYRAARAGLGRLRPDRPTATASPAEITEYIVDVEDILLGEVRTWSEKWGAAAENHDL
jgi:hypothetical protein